MHAIEYQSGFNGNVFKFYLLYKYAWNNNILHVRLRTTVVDMYFTLLKRLTIYKGKESHFTHPYFVSGLVSLYLNLVI